MIDSRKRFSITANVYNSSRPSYPNELISWIIATSGLKKESTIADIGCGTGISTRLFLHKGFKVIGIEPNEEMLNVAREIDGDFYKKGEAIKTGLNSKSIDVLLTAQAMHWFDFNPALKEFKRILKPEGWCFAFWNIRKKTDLLKKYDLLIGDYSTDYAKTPKSFQVIENIKSSNKAKNIIEQEFFYLQKFDQQGLIERAFSTSYVAHGIEDKNNFENQLKVLFQKYQKNNNITFDYRTIAIGWQFV